MHIMASSGENEEAHTALSNTTRIHIAYLSPTDISGGRHIEAAVVLVWPYSSATKELSLLLAERDVSLRKARGQVKVTFHGAVAREVARLKPGIGDKVQLGLRDIELVAEQDEVSTPGKKAGFTLHSRRAVVLHVFPDNGSTRLVNFVAPTTPPTSPPQLSHGRNGAIIEFETPASSHTLDISKTRAAPDSAAKFRTSQRLSSNSFPGSLVDPFTEEDGYVQGRGRKRAKFARYSGAWRLADSDEELDVDVDHTPGDSGVVDGTSPGDEHVSEAEEVVDVTQGPSPVKSLVAEPHFAEVPREEQPQMLKHTSIENGSASSIDDHASIEYKHFEQLPSPESEHDDESESSSSSTDQIIPVERMSMSPAASTSVATPRLEAVTSPGLPIVSPFVSNNQHFPSFPGHTSQIDASAQPIEQANAVLPVSERDVQDAAMLTERSETPVPAFYQEVTQTVLEHDAQLAIPPSGLVAQDIDLDALQQQIEIENGEGFGAETIGNVNEDEDMYGPPALRLFEPESALEEQHAFPQMTAATTSNAGNPILLDDDDNDSKGEEDQATGETGEGETDDDADEDELREDMNEDLAAKQTVLDAQEAEEILDEILESESEVSVAAETPSVASSLPISARSNAVLVGDKRNEDGPELPHTYVDLESPESAMQSEDDVAPDRDDMSTFNGAAPASTRSPQYFDGMPDEVGPVAMPLLPVDMVDVELAPVNGQPIDILDSTDDHKDSGMEEGITDTVLSQSASEGPGAVVDEPSTPQGVQINNTSPEDQGELQPDLVYETLSRPFDNQQLPPEEVDHPLVERDDALPPLPQTDGPPTRRASRRLLEKPPMSDNVYSDYFTPRKPATKVKNAALSENASLSTGQTREQIGLGSSSPRSEMHIDEERERPVAQPMLEMRQPTEAGNAPWASSRGVATNMGYYVYLDYLGDYYDQLVDVMAICTADATAPERAKSGPKDFNATIHLADSSASADNSTTTTAQIFRPRKHAIPAVKRGDVVLLRNFKVQTQLHKPFLLSTDESAWAVFNSTEQNASVAGPPVEFGDMERAFAARLFGWWTNQGKNRYPDLPTQTQSQAADGRAVLKKPAPQPLDLRRSPRRTRQDRDSRDSEPPSEQEPSPSFNPTSPTFSKDSARGPTPTRPTSAVASLTSPASGMATRSTRSASAAAAGPEDKGKAAAPASEAGLTQLSPPRSRSRHVQIQQTAVSDHTDDEHESVQHHPAEDDSTIMSGTETSASSKRRHRHERVSTSLIHELRDGTQWVDVDDFEVVSVSEQETEDEDDNGQDPGVQSTAQPGPTAQDISPQSLVSDTPSKRGRGRPRKEPTSGRRGRPRKIPQHQHPQEQDEGSTTGSEANDTPSKQRPDQLQSEQPQHLQVHADQADERPQSSHSQASAAAAEAGSGRVTRSKAAMEHNIHELRDGATYED